MSNGSVYSHQMVSNRRTYGHDSKASHRTCKGRGAIRKSDGKGLYIVVPDSGSPYWALGYSVDGKCKQMTLGQYADMSLADARTEAEVFKRELRQGVDPLIVKQRQK